MAFRTAVVGRAGFDRTDLLPAFAISPEKCVASAFAATSDPSDHGWSLGL